LDDDVFSHPNNTNNVNDRKAVNDKNNEDVENDRHRSWNSTDRESQSDNE